MEPACHDGDIVWAVWQTASDVRKQIRERLPTVLVDIILSMAGELPQAGFTGFFKPNLILDDGGKFVCCQNNRSFWARRIEGPTHYWETGDKDFGYIHVNVPGQPLGESDDSSAEDSDPQ